MTTITAINLAEKFGLINDTWSPRIVAELNGQHVKLAKIQGEFIWHSHPDVDELFLVVSGQLEMRLRDQTLMLGPGEICVIPRGVEHCPAAAALCDILMFEPVGTLNTGNADASDHTVEDPAWL